MTPREQFIAALRSKIGYPYRWGGDGPDNFDCSGIILFCLRAAGWQMADVNAHQLSEMMKQYKVDTINAQPGCLYFYGSPQVHHVMACLHRWPDGHVYLAGARGGDQRTKDYEIAYSQRACVDVVNGDYWQSELNFIADPFKV